MKRILLFWLLLVWFTNGSNAQSIRKDYREMTDAEMNDYVAALNLMKSSGVYNTIVAQHGTQGHLIHGTPIFLPWHRMYVLDFEAALQSSNSQYNYLSVPYWYWGVDDVPPSWFSGFLNRNRLSSTNPSYNWNIVTRSGFDSNRGLIPDASFMTSILGDSNFGNFNNRLENIHGSVHVYSGYPMTQVAVSPNDPIFFLHHANVDNYWQRWENTDTDIQSSLSNWNSTLPGYSNNSISTITGRNIPAPPYLQQRGINRNWDVWYAHRNRVVLDGDNGVTFRASDTSYPYVYRYFTRNADTEAGQILVGDIRQFIPLSGFIRAVQLDNRGGFEVENGVKCDFLAGATVTFYPGFEAKYGSNVSARIITAANSMRQSTITENLSITNGEDSGLKLQGFPNPVTNLLTIEFSLNVDGIVSIELFDMNGILEKQIQHNGIIGKNEVKIDATNISNGMHICKVNDGYLGGSIKVIKL